MCMCMRICESMCSVYVHEYVHGYVYVLCTCTCVCIRMFLYACMYVCICTYMYVYVRGLSALLIIGVCPPCYSRHPNHILSPYRHHHSLTPPLPTPTVVRATNKGSSPLDTMPSRGRGGDREWDGEGERFERAKIPLLQ